MATMIFDVSTKKYGSGISDFLVKWAANLKMM